MKGTKGQKSKNSMSKNYDEELTVSYDYQFTRMIDLHYPECRFIYVTALLSPLNFIRTTMTFNKD